VQFPDSDSSRKLVCTYPLPFGSNLPYGNIAFFVKEDIFQKITGDLLGSFEGAVFIINKEREAIFKLGNENFISNDKIADIISKDYVQGISNMDFENTKLSIINIISSESGLQYVSIMSHDKYMHNFIQIRKEFLFAVLFVVLLGVIISLYLAKLNYRPIKNLFESTNRYFEKSVSRKACNEIEYIKNSFDDILKSNTELREHYKFNKSFITQQILFILLSLGNQ